MSHKVVAILQARTSSSRLPGKVLMDLGGQPMLMFMLERLRKAQRIDQIIVATSNDASDDPLVTALESQDVSIFRGSLNDVLDRFRCAALASHADVIVRLTGDCPLIDPTLVDACVAQIQTGQFDYSSTTDPATYPDGLDCEAFTMAALHEAWSKAKLPSEREHVTPFIRQLPRVRKANIASVVDLSSLRWTVDYEDDLDLIRQVVTILGDAALTADRFDCLRAFEKVAAAASNQHHRRNEGYASSLANDEKSAL